MQFLRVLALVACCGGLTASPLLRGPALPDGISIEEVFAACGMQGGSPDLGPCLEELLSGLIELSRPQFATGIKVGGKTIVLEPLTLKDIPEKTGGKFRFSASNLTVRGLSSLTVPHVTLLPDRLALELALDRLTASSNMTLRYLIFSGRPDVALTLTKPRIRVQAGYSLVNLDGHLGVSLTEPRVAVSIAGFTADISGLGGLGDFLETFLNNNSKVLLDIFLPEMQRQAEDMLKKEFKTFKIM